jgi:1-acyl-sn-glycerol-3-phosphate acyltransferase
MPSALQSLPGPAKGVFAFLVFGLNTVFWCLLLYAVAALRLLLPFAAAKKALTRAAMAIAENWISVNSWGIDAVGPIGWDVVLPEGLRKGGWYLVGCNHRSLVDIVVLQRVFNRRIPLLKFFLKRELIRVPFLGLAWWALDFPFMKRHTREEMERNPALRGEDLETTRRACERFRWTPVSVINFLEGTRFSEAKRIRKGSPYRHLLPPKAGGVAFALEAMGGMFERFLDVTIAYPRGTPGFWDVLCGRLPLVVVRVESMPVPPEWTGGDYEGDPAFRGAFQAEVRRIWEKKDELIGKLLPGDSRAED